ncbi:hypothetical protein IFT74_15545 [Oxalobacteraceae sp. CFBP 8755]|nr:hypothetical protein [Oxalobacteraceae sp. CFBP 8755]
MSQSIADQFIDTMAALRALDIASDDPMRHVMRSLKQEAEQIISEALRSAWTLAHHARNAQKDAAVAVKEALEATAQNEKKEST